MNSSQTFKNKSIETQDDNFGIESNDNKNTPRVNINHLLSRVREEEKRKKKENLVFLGLAGTVVVITGVIASL